jgi:hypothetical protein
MRLMIIKQPTDLKAFTSQISTSRAGVDRASIVARLKALNPHLDFARLEAGSVVLLPDLPEIKPASGNSLGGDAFSLLTADLDAGFNAAAKRLRAAAEIRATERSAVESALDDPAVQEALHSDAQLQRQLESGKAQFAADHDHEQAAIDALAAARKAAAQDLKALRQLFR